ncbi:ROK family transcriptional regulator [Microlunatus antarcticus]|uniref:Putative NBD/HSP70 family sugar kinase n=1 Tax=Microlunatus antarcticus TaxID=53388 RepID=A0A7W5P6E8_9ACTN|nr:ROK family transcriptional regulator [Microlunatus antarcticus]MBB3326435.1 putative NBD/HSP70 family sugar kinase [Microlunatus antarcticus]
MDAGPQRLKGSSYRGTRSAVLDLIRSSDGVSRVELSRRSGLTEATISKIVKDLLADGVVVNAGEAESTGGKRPQLLRLSTSTRYAVGITLDISTSVIVLCGLDGAPIAERRIPGFGRDEPAPVVSRAASAVMGLLRDQGVPGASIIGVGLASSGRRRSPLGWGEDAAVADRWERFDTGEALAERLGLPVTVENDANCAALGVFWSGGKDAPRTFMTVYMSEGIGAGIVIAGSLYRGASGNSGEIGHVTVDAQGRPCWCGANGCLETVGPPRAIIAQVLADDELRRTFEVDADTEPGTVHRRVLEAAETGSATALDLLRSSARQVADVVRGLANTLDLDSIFLAGPGFGSAAPIYLAAIRTRLAEASLARGVHAVNVEFAGGGPEVAALGAASVVLHSALTPHHDLAVRW